MIECSVSDLINFSERDSHLKKYLNTKIKDLPRGIEFSMGRNMYKEFYKKTFLEYFIDLFRREFNLSLFITKHGDEVLGWVAYVNEVWNDAMSNVRFGSFYSEDTDLDHFKNLRFMQDIRRTFEKKIRNGTAVYFVADRNCPFNRHYFNYIKEAGGGGVIDNGKRYLSFAIKAPKKEIDEKPVVWKSFYSKDDAEELLESIKNPVCAERAKELFRKVYGDEIFDAIFDKALNKDDVRPEIKKTVKGLLMVIDDPVMEFENPWNEEAVKILREVVK